MNEYWDNHFLFDKSSSHLIKQIGDSLIKNIYVNSIVPLKMTRLQKVDKEVALNKGILMLKAIKPESNHIVNAYAKIGIYIESAAASQALIELDHSFCTPKKCMECMIAQEITQNIQAS